MAAGRFHRDGHHRVPTAEVAAGVGITAPALYRHFRGELELLDRTVRVGQDALAGAARSAVRSAGPSGGPAPSTVGRRRPDGGPAGRRAARTRRRGRRVALPVGAFGGGRALLPIGRPAGAAPDPAAPPGRPPCREELLAAAVRLFHRHGFDNAGTDRLGAAVGISGASVYRHLDSKAQWPAATLVRGRERLWHEGGGVITADPGGRPERVPAAALAASVDVARRDRLIRADDPGRLRSAPAGRARRRRISRRPAGRPGRPGRGACRCPAAR
ncbi:TetR family transcriptional regulator [Kitasatospora sp. NPDC015120]|uniref:TetR family transcriptional regulator n=1 Tax=Kitasatospora sp. NPDC015120 TaxID=3364023 RepID=UPI0036F4730F